MIITNYVSPDGHKTKIIAKKMKDVVRNVEELEKAHDPSKKLKSEKTSERKEVRNEEK